MYNKMHSWICIIMYKCARMSASMLCVCVSACPHVFVCMKDFNTLPLLRRTPSSQLWSSSCGHLVGFHSHGMSWITPTAWWFTMENHGKSRKSYGNPMETGWFRAFSHGTPHDFGGFVSLFGLQQHQMQKAMGMRHVDVSSNGCLMAKYVMLAA